MKKKKPSLFFNGPSDKTGWKRKSKNENKKKSIFYFLFF
jgi:hypothetical protein